MLRSSSFAAAAALALLAAAARGAPAQRATPAEHGPRILLPGPLGAFPGCQGSGCETRGGFDARAGAPTVYRVTTLSDAKQRCTIARGKADGCALRDCVEATGPRVCVFAVAGTIHTTGMAVANPYLTVRGDTAPGMGIQIDANGKTLNLAERGIFWIRTHDVVLRGLRARDGSDNGPRSDTHAIVAYAGDLHHLVLDHLSLSWGHDEVLDIFAGGGVPDSSAPRELTLSHSIVAEGLAKGPNSRGAILGPENAAQGAHMRDIDVHHNYFANNHQRNPNVRTRSARIVNNVLFNWGGWGIQLWGGVQADVVANLGQPGPLTTRRGFVGVGYEGRDAAPGPQSVYLAGNRFRGGPVQGWDSPIVTADSGPATRRADPLPPSSTGPAIVAEPADALEASVLGPGGAGASRRLDCGGAWVSTAVRDAVDQRLVGAWWSPPPSFRIPAYPAETGGFPEITPVASTSVCAASSRDNARCACADSDGDGIPDYWERAFCGGPTACAPLAATVSPPWTNLEAFLSGMHAAP